MPYITLTSVISSNRPHPIYVRTDHIQTIEPRTVRDLGGGDRRYTSLTMLSGPKLEVHETPDHVLGLIEEKEAI